jgi:hypothetical protein
MQIHYLRAAFSLSLQRNNRTAGERPAPIPMF